jgi:CDP-glucose 4,6-dehydratase
LSGRYEGARVLVTGAQGFVGCAVSERLLDEGARVVALRRDVDPEARFYTDGVSERCVQALGDLTDYESLLRILNEDEIEMVFHLGAQAIVTAANRNPLATWESNVRGTYTLLEACRVHALGSDAVRRIVVASSDKAYGDHEELPYREDLPLQARYPYDVSKAATDMIARSYAVTYDMPIAVTRLANVYGPGDLNWTRIIPDTARTLLKGETPVIRSDGSPERDYLYVADAVDAYLAISASLDRRELWGRAWNAGCGKAVSVIDVTRRLIAVSGRDVEPDIQGEGPRRGEIDRQFLDSSAMRDELGWQAGWDLDRGLRAAWEWYSKRLG